MEQMIPGFLEEMLKKQYGEEAFAKILAGYQARRPVTLRVNPLKADRNTVEQALTGQESRLKMYHGMRMR